MVGRSQDYDLMDPRSHLAVDFDVPEPSTSSPTSKLRSCLQESISSSKLYRDISPTRVYIHAPQNETRTSLPDLFKQRKGLEYLRPTLVPETEGLEDASKQPRLLQRLEALLEEKLSLVHKLGATSKGFAATQIKTDAYRQVFDAFLHSFTTYRSLLLRIKHEYDISLDDALGSVYDNVHMRAELAISEERMDTAMREARAKALEDAASIRQELEDQHLQHEQIAVEAEQRCRQADAEIARIKANISALRKEHEELMKQNRKLKHDMLSGSSWSSPSLLAKYYDPPSGDGVA